MDLLGAPPAHRPQVEALGDRELLEKDVSLRHGRLPDHAQAAIGRLDRIAPVRVMRGEVGGAHPPAHCRDPVGDPLGELSAVEDLGPAIRDRPKGLGEVGLLQHLARTRVPAARAIRVGRGVVVREPVGLFGDRGREDGAHREPLGGVADGRGEDAVDPEPALVGQDVAPGRDAARHGRERHTAIPETLSEASGHNAFGGRSGSVVRSDLACARVVDEGEDVAADRRAVREDYSADRGCRDRGVGRRPAVAERVEAGDGGEVMSARDDAVGGPHGRAVGHRPDVRRPTAGRPR